MTIAIEPREPPPPLVEEVLRQAGRVSTIGGALKILFAGIVLVASGIGGAYAWAQGKATKADVSTVASANASAIADSQAKMAAMVERVSRLEGKVDVVIDQNGKILHMLSTLNDRDVRRGSPTRLPTDGMR